MAQVAAFGVLALLLVEALLRLVAQPLLLEHLVDKRRKPHLGALVFDLRCLRGEVLRHMRHHIDADHVAEAKGSRLWPTDRRAGQRVDLFDREPLLLHQTNRIAHREGPDAVRDEVRRIVRVDDRLAQAQVAEVLDRSHIGRISVRRRDDLEQPHIARRIEEVRAEPVAAQLHRHAFDDLVDRQAAGVAGDDRVGAAMLLHLVEQRPFDLQVLGDDFDDPVAVGNQSEIIVEVADRDQPRAVGRIEGRGLRLLQSIERSEDDLVPLLLRRVGVGARRNDVQQHHRKAGVGHMSGDARAHGSGSEDGHLVDLSVSRYGLGRGCSSAAGGHLAGSGGRFTRTMRSILNDHSVRQVNAWSISQTLILQS